MKLLVMWTWEIIFNTISYVQETKEHETRLKWIVEGTESAREQYHYPDKSIKFLMKVLLSVAPSGT